MTRICAILAVILVLAVTPASALTRDSLLQGNLGLLSLHAEASWDGSGWLYQYTLTCDSTAPRVAHVFSLDNPYGSVYTEAANTGGFLDPIWSSGVTPEWRNVTAGLSEGDSATFSFKSIYAPADENVFVMVLNGGTAAWGDTIGMSDKATNSPAPAIPEAGTLSLAAAGMAALSGLRYGRSRARK